MFGICYTKEMNKEAIILQVKQKYEVLDKVLDERSRRIWAGTEAKAIGRGGQLLIAQATGIHKNTVSAGVKEINEKQEIEKGRIRKSGGGRKRITYKDKMLEEDIKAQVEASTLGDPENPLLWSSKSTRKIADALNKETNRISHASWQKNCKIWDIRFKGIGKPKKEEAADRDANSISSTTKSKNFKKEISL